MDALSRRVAASVALGLVSGIALIGLYLLVVSVAQGADHALALLWNDALFVSLISAGFGTQIGLFVYVRLLQRDLAREALVLAGTGTATSSLSMVACCAHHLADLLPVVGLPGIALFLVEYRTPLMLLGLATNAAGIAMMLRVLRDITADVRVVARHSPAVPSA